MMKSFRESAQDRLADMGARRADAVNRRDSYSGVNIDEELAQLVTLQNSYSAAARIMTTATQMYDTLIGMLMDTQIGSIEEALNKLRDGLLSAVGTGRADGLQEVAEEAFQLFRTALNSDEAGVHLFAGAQVDTATFPARHFGLDGRAADRLRLCQ